MLNRTPAERIERRVDKSGSCWIWLGATQPNGYGKLRINKRLLLAHRVSYEVAIGPIPEGLDIDHLCRNRLCVNPAHLEPVSRRENLLRGVGLAARGRGETCPRGHPWTPDNTYVRKNGTRNCQECRRIRDRA